VEAGEFFGVMAVSFSVSLLTTCWRWSCKGKEVEGWKMKHLIYIDAGYLIMLPLSIVNKAGS
jgi:hypothetical protein